MRAPERYAGPRRLCAVLLVAERDPQLLGQVRGERARASGRAARARRSSASRLARLSSGWRASTRFSKSLMRSNRRITLRTALCISSASMSSVIFSTPFSHHFASCARRCSVLSPARPPRRRRAPRVGGSAAAARASSRVRVLPHLRQEAVAAQHRRVAPVQRALRARRVEHRQAHRVRAVALDELVRVDHVAEMLAHLAPVADHHLVEQAARERLAVGEERERADVAQRLRHRPLVEHEVAAVRARHQPLGGQPVAQVGQREDLLQRVLARLRRHARRHPQPQRVEVAVQRVRLAPRRPAARRAGRVARTPPARPAGCPCPSGGCPAAAAPAAARAAPAPCRSARSRRSGSACPTSAGGRPRSRTRGSAPPGAGRGPPLARAGPRPRSRHLGSRPSRRRDHLVGAVAPRHAQHRRRRRSASPRAGRRSPAAPAARARDACARCRSAGSSRPRARCAPSRRCAAARAARAPPGPTAHALDVGVARRDQHEARLPDARRAWGVNTVSCSPVGGPAQLELDAVDAARARSAGRPARPRPRSRSPRARPGARRSPARRR